MCHVVLQLVAVVHHARLDRQVVGVVRFQRARGIVHHYYRIGCTLLQRHATQRDRAHAIPGREHDRVGRMFAVSSCIRASRLRAAHRQASLVHHRHLVGSARIHLVRIGVLRRSIRVLRIRIRVTHLRRLVAQRDRQRGRGRIAVTILQRVGKHIVHATLGGRRIAQIAVAAVRLDRQHTVQALHHGIARGCHRLGFCTNHLRHCRTVCAFGVVLHHVTRNRQIAACRHAVGIDHRTRHIVHDRDRHAATGRLAVLVCHHQIQLRQIQAIRARTCCMRHVVLQLVAVVHHARLDRQVVGVVRLQRARGIIQHGHRCCGIAPQYDTTQLHRTHTVFGRKVSRTCILYASSARS